MIGTVGRYLLSAALVLLSRDALRQAMGELRDTEPGSQLFAALQLVMGVSAAVGAVGVFRRAHWATRAIASWGIATAGLLAVQPLYAPMDKEAQQGIAIGVAVVLIAAAGAAWSARRLAAPRLTPKASTQGQASPDRPSDLAPLAAPILPPASAMDLPRAPAEPVHDERTAKPGPTSRQKDPA